MPDIASARHPAPPAHGRKLAMFPALARRHALGQPPLERAAAA
jgi:hypothetical protein